MFRRTRSSAASPSIAEYSTGAPPFSAPVDPPPYTNACDDSVARQFSAPTPPSLLQSPSPPAARCCARAAVGDHPASAAVDGPMGENGASCTGGIQNGDSIRLVDRGVVGSPRHRGRRCSLPGAGAGGGPRTPPLRASQGERLPPHSAPGLFLLGKIDNGEEREDVLSTF